MVRISAETKYRLENRVEEGAMYYVNTTHIYRLNTIYTATAELHTEVYDVVRVTRISRKDVGRLAEEEVVGYIQFYPDRIVNRTEFFR